MATTPTTVWPMSAADLCKASAVEIGAISNPDELEDSERDQMFVRLNAMLNQWAVEANMFREVTTTLTVPGGTGKVELPADALVVNSISHIVSPTYSRMLFQWNRAEFTLLPNRIQTGNPTVYYLAKSTAGMEIALWPIPSADIDLFVDYGRSVFTVTQPEEGIDIPQQWQNAVLLGLAARSASMFGMTRIDPTTVANVTNAADAAYQRMLDADRPDSQYFYPYDGCYC